MEFKRYPIDKTSTSKDETFFEVILFFSFLSFLNLKKGQTKRKLRALCFEGLDAFEKRDEAVFRSSSILVWFTWLCLLR
jgi:hypothetical protein